MEQAQEVLLQAVQRPSRGLLVSSIHSTALLEFVQCTTLNWSHKSLCIVFISSLSLDLTSPNAEIFYSSFGCLAQAAYFHMLTKASLLSFHMDLLMHCACTLDLYGAKGIFIAMYDGFEMPAKSQLRYATNTIIERSYRAALEFNSILRHQMSMSQLDAAGQNRIQPVCSRSQ